MDSFNNAIADSIAVKVSFNGDLRRFPLPRGASFKALYEQVTAILGVQGTELVLRYVDEEGDLITISSDWELNSAIKPGQMLRLTASIKGEQASAPPFASPFAVAGGTPFQGNDFGNTAFAPASPFSGPVPASPFGGPAAAPFAGPFGGPAPAGPFGGPSPAGPFAPRAGPFGGPFPHGHHGAFAGGCGGWGGRGRVSHAEWEKMKKERKAQCTPEEWRKLKEERKRVCKEFKKMGKHGHHGHGHGGRYGGFPGYFGPHAGGHPAAPFGHCGADADAEKLTARFAKDVTIEDGAQIAGGTPFVKTWRIRNEGEAWPAGCVLRSLTKHSDSMGSPETVPVPFEGGVGTGQEFDISVPLVAPTKAGRYTAYFKMCSPAGKKFGQRLWASIVVPSVSSSSSEGEKEADKYESQVDTILAMGFTAKRHRVFRLLQKFDGDVEKTTQVLHQKTQRKALKEQMKAQKKAFKNQQ